MFPANVTYNPYDYNYDLGCRPLTCCMFSEVNGIQDFGTDPSSIRLLAAHIAHSKYEDVNFGALLFTQVTSGIPRNKQIGWRLANFIRKYGFGRVTTVPTTFNPNEKSTVKPYVWTFTIAQDKKFRSWHEGNEQPGYYTHL